MKNQSLLAILADGDFHSGRELGELLSVSRSAVWKQIKKLEALGLEVYSVKGRGYRVPGGLNLLDEGVIASKLTEYALGYLSKIDLELSIPSTNRAAMLACQQENAHGRVFIAEQQTSGRGRRGREWVSPFGRNLYFSTVWRFQQGVLALDGLSLLVGLCVLNALRALGAEGVELKWPNDLLWKGRKLAGILLELNGEPSGECQVVIGVGVNTSMPKSEALKIDQPWVDLSSILGRPACRNTLVAALLDELAKVLPRFEQEGFKPWVDEWQARHAYQGEPVRLLLGNSEKSGICLGIDEVGALRLRTEDGIEAYHAGEISVRPLAAY